MKPRPTPTLSADRDKLRAATAYGASRTCVSLVLLLGGALAIVAGGLMLSPGVVVAGIFQLGLAGLAGAIFDLADAALAARRSDEGRTTREVAALRSRSDSAAPPPW